MCARLPAGEAVCPLKPCKPQVGRNCDRGDAAKLPPEQLDMCEIEPMRLEEPGSNRCVSLLPTLCRCARSFLQAGRLCAQ